MPGNLEYPTVLAPIIVFLDRGLGSEEPRLLRIDFP